MSSVMYQNILRNLKLTSNLRCYGNLKSFKMASDNMSQYTKTKLSEEAVATKISQFLQFDFCLSCFELG